MSSRCVHEDLRQFLVHHKHYLTNILTPTVGSCMVRISLTRKIEDGLLRFASVRQIFPIHRIPEAHTLVIELGTDIFDFENIEKFWEFMDPGQPCGCNTEDLEEGEIEDGELS